MDRGHLPEGWKIKKIREIGKVQTGSTPKTSDKNNFGDDISFIKPPDFLKDGSLNYSNQGLSKLGTKEARIIDKDSVLMVCIGATIGKVGFTEKEVTANQQINSLTPLNGDYPKFIFYQMLTKNFQQKVLDSSGQATLPIINKTKWSELSLFLPSPDEQKRIVAILDEAFEGIDQAIRNTEKNLANARELFDSYLNKIFTEKGDGWEEKTIGECFKVKSGDFLPKKNANSSGDFDVYGGNGFTGKHDKFNLSGCNIVIGRVGAKCGNVRSINKKIWLTDNAFYISTFLRKFDYDFLAIILKMSNLGQTANQMAQPVISYKTIQPVLLSYPVDLKTQKEIIEKVNEVKAETQLLETIYSQKIAALNELKQSILQKAFTGQLTQKSL